MDAPPSWIEDIFNGTQTETVPEPSFVYENALSASPIIANTLHKGPSVLVLPTLTSVDVSQVHDVQVEYQTTTSTPVMDVSLQPPTEISPMSSARETPISLASQIFELSPTQRAQFGQQIPANITQQYFPGPTDQSYSQQQQHQHSQSQPQEQFAKNNLDPPSVSPSYQRLKEMVPLSPAAESAFLQYLQESQRQRKSLNLAQCVTMRNRLREQMMEPVGTIQAGEWTAGAPATQSRSEGRLKEQFGQTAPETPVWETRTPMDEIISQGQDVSRLGLGGQRSQGMQRPREIQQDPSSPLITSEMMQYYDSQNARPAQQSHLSEIGSSQHSRMSRSPPQQQQPPPSHSQYLHHTNAGHSKQPPWPYSEPISWPESRSSPETQSTQQGFRGELFDGQDSASLRYSEFPRPMTVTPVTQRPGQLQQLAAQTQRSQPNPPPPTTTTSKLAVPPREPSPEETPSDLFSNRPKFSESNPSLQNPMTRIQPRSESISQPNLLYLLPRLQQILNLSFQPAKLAFILSNHTNVNTLPSILLSENLITKSQVPFIQAQLARPIQPKAIRGDTKVLIIEIIQNYVVETKRPELLGTIDEIVKGRGDEAVADLSRALRGRGLFNERDFEVVEQRAKVAIAKVSGEVDLRKKSQNIKGSVSEVKSVGQSQFGTTAATVKGLPSRPTPTEIPSKPFITNGTQNDGPAASSAPPRSQKGIIIAYAHVEKDLSSQIASWSVDQIARNVLLAAGRRIPHEIAPRLNEALEDLASRWKQLKHADLTTLKWDVLDPPKLGTEQAVSMPNSVPQQVPQSAARAEIMATAVSARSNEVDLTTLTSVPSKPSIPELTMSNNDVAGPKVPKKRGRPRKQGQPVKLVALPDVSSGLSASTPLIISISSSTKSSPANSVTREPAPNAPSFEKKVGQVPVLAPHYVSDGQSSTTALNASLSKSMTKIQATNAAAGNVKFRKSSDMHGFPIGAPYFGKPVHVQQHNQPTTAIQPTNVPFAPIPSTKATFPSQSSTVPSGNVSRLGASMFRPAKTQVPIAKPPAPKTKSSLPSTPTKSVTLNSGEYTPPKGNTTPQVVIISPAQRMTPRAAIISDDDDLVDITPSKPSAKRTSPQHRSVTKTPVSRRKNARPTAGLPNSRSTPQKGASDLTTPIKAIPLAATSSSEEEDSPPPIGEDEKHSPTSKSYPCRWRACHADLHSFETLEQHILKVHGKPDPKTKVSQPKDVFDYRCLRVCGATVLLRGKVL